jgi:glycine/D-amino acid oxidase-like deaminating enzyme
MGFTADGLPLVGGLPGGERIVMCGGYTGHGMGFAAECAAIAVALIVDGVPPPPYLTASRPGSALGDRDAPMVVAPQF